MRFSTTGKLWFGYLFAKAALSFYEDQQAARERASHFHGYPWPQMRAILSDCFEARPDIHRACNEVDDDQRLKVLTTIFTCGQAHFRRLFRFDRPAPR